MIEKLLKAVTPRGTAAVLVAFMALSGCERKPSPPPEKPGAKPPAALYDRQKDPDYRAALSSIDAERRKVGSRRARIAGELRKIYEKAVPDFPKGTPQEKIEAAIAANPRKYPGWREFKSAFDRVDAEFSAVQVKARNTVGQGVRRELESRKATAAEKRAAMPPPPAEPDKPAKEVAPVREPLRAPAKTAK